MSEASAAQRWQQTALEAAFAWLSRHAQHPATCDRIIGNGACTCGLEALHDMLCQGVAKAQPTSHPSKPIAFPDKALFEDRFWSHVDKSQPDACWLWRGSVASNGYGRLTVRQVDYGVHRLAYCLANGPIPPGLLVCHSCDNRLCVNPTHLWLGDVVANNRDMEAKGQDSGPTPERRTEEAAA